MSVPLTPTGEAAVAELAERYRVSDGAVRALLDAVIRGGGAMAQFSHPDLGGSGQWMRGGMTMVGDERTYDFGPAIWFWLGSSILSIVLATCLWRTRLRD